MTEEARLQMEFEPVDDIPLLLEQMKTMQLAETIDAHIKPHGNWQGTLFGPLICLLLAYILSESDHRLCAVLPWAQQRCHVIEHSAGFAWQDRELADDHLATVLRHLSEDPSWFDLEAELNGRTIEVFELYDEAIRLDSTTGRGHWKILMDGLFQRGHSKDKRPDLPQIRIMMGSIDPLGSPVYTQVYSGNRTDDRLYLPAVKVIKEGLGREHLLFVGDCKMGSQENRATIDSGKDYYFCLLSAIQFTSAQKADLLERVKTGEIEPTPIFRHNEKEGEPEFVGYGFESTENCEYELDGTLMQWEERRMAILSLSLMQQNYERLGKKIAKAQDEIAQLNIRKQGRKLYRELEPFQEKVSEILEIYGVEEFVDVNFPVEVTRRKIRKWQGRPARIEKQKRFLVESSKKQEKLFDAAFSARWRVYATNAPAQRLGLEDAYLGYRKSHRIDGNCFKRLKGVPLNLIPTHLARPDHAKGMVRLLSLGLRVLSELEFVARRALESPSEQPLSGLYPGNPKRLTERPTARSLLQAFKGIALGCAA